MFAEKIPVDLIESRIDADFYQPKFINALKLIRAHKSRTLELLTNFVRKGIFDMPANLYTEQGVPFLRISDIDGISVNLESTIKIPKWKHDEEFKTKLCGGDLVLSKVGTTGQVAKVPDGADVNISQNLVGISVNHDFIDSDYLLAVLNSPTMFLCIDRHVTTAVQGKLTLDILRTLEVPFFQEITQKYIGDKVRQAEQLRAWAAKIQAESTSAMPVFKPLINHYTKNSFRVPLENVIATRLDSSFSHPDHRSVVLK